MFLHSVIIIDIVDIWCFVVQYINEVETSTNATRASVTTDLRDCVLSSHRCATRFCLAPYLRCIFFCNICISNQILSTTKHSRIPGTKRIVRMLVLFHGARICICYSSKTYACWQSYATWLEFLELAELFCQQL